MTGILEEIMKNKEDILVKILDVLEGKEARAEIDLDGLQFELGDSKVKLGGKVTFTFVPYEKKK